VALSNPFHLLADPVLGQGLAPVHVPGVQHQPDAPEEQRERRPEEISARERPGPDQGGVHHQIDEQVYAEVALLLEAGDRSVTKVLVLVGRLSARPAAGVQVHGHRVQEPLEVARVQVEGPHGVEHGREHRVVNVVAEVTTGQLRI
jgi:hypothetical protein